MLLSPPLRGNGGCGRPSASHPANASVLMFPKGRKTLGTVAAPMATIRHHIKCVQYEAKNQNLQELERMDLSIQHPVLYIHCGVLTFTVLCKILGIIFIRIDGS